MAKNAVGTGTASCFPNMKLLILTIIAACSLTALTSCADTDRPTTTTSTYQESAYVDSKDMHHRQGQ
jgi:hypothetical protein